MTPRNKKNAICRKHHSEQTKKLLSEQKKGNKNSMWGKPPWNKNKTWVELYGAKRAEELKNLVKERCLGKKHTEETIKKMRGKIPWNKGKEGCFSKETRQKMRQRKLGTHQSEETKKRRSEMMSGKNHPRWGTHPNESTLQKLRDSHLGQISNKKGKNFEELYGREKAGELKERHSKLMRELWKNEAYAKRIIEKTQIEPNGHELYLDYVLQNHFPGEWKYVGDGEKLIDGLCPDFINVNGKNFIIELFGEFWHKKKMNIPERYTEDGRKKVFAENGYVALIIWDCELLDEQKMVEKINNFFYHQTKEL